MGFAILRVQKLKHGIAVQRSMKHALREQETPNADPERLADNTASVKTVSEALERFNGRLATQDKVRINAVLAVEYLVTASPEAMQGKSKKEQDAYFQDALRWLHKRHGAENVVAWGIHRDETTPHLYAVVVPIDGKGKLNCRAFLGGSKALSDMQSEFAERVGKEHGLDRGIEGSKAKHTRIRDYYARVNSVSDKTPNIDLPEPKVLESTKAYGKRVAELTIETLKPELLANRAKASETLSAQREAKAMRDAAEDVQRRAQAVLEPLKGLNRENQLLLIKTMQVAAGRLAEKQRNERQSKIQKPLQRDNGKEIGRDI